MKSKCVTICSGGMDSATLAYFVASQDYEQVLVTFDYGQRHSRELEAARLIAEKLSVQHHIVTLKGMNLAGSALTDNKVNVPEGHYAQESMKLTVVPNRNAIMLSIAWGIAVSISAEKVAYGAHSGDHAIYPDCRPEFARALANALRQGNEGLGNPELGLYVPFISYTKGEIVKLGLGFTPPVPYELTYTCYKGADVSCGKCGSCVERQQAFADNGIEDPLPYADREFWKQAVANYQETK